MSKWEILHGAGDVAIYNGLKKIFHVFPEEAKIVCDILNRLEDEVERLKAERQEWADMCIRKESELNRMDAEVERLTIEKKLQYDEFRSERNAMEDKISSDELHIDSLNREVEMLRQEIRNRLSDENKALARVGELTSEIARCKSERLGAEEILDECVLQFEHLNKLFAETGTTNSLLARITAFRASQQTTNPEPK